MRTRRFALAFIVFLVVADALGAGYLWLLWHERHGLQARAGGPVEQAPH